MQLLNLATDLRFATTPYPLCTLDVRVATLATSLGAELTRWEEDGLGYALGFALQLSSGVAVLLEELEHAVKHLGAQGPTLHVDARALAEHGVDALVAQVLAALRLSSEVVSWRQSDEGRALAARF